MEGEQAITDNRRMGCCRLATNAGGIMSPRAVKQASPGARPRPADSVTPRNREPNAEREDRRASGAIEPIGRMQWIVRESP